jgi:hypothetical protein
MVLLLVLGAAGAGLALLALRQGWAQVRTHAPSPLPDSVTTETGQALVPWPPSRAWRPSWPPGARYGASPGSCWPGSAWASR